MSFRQDHRLKIETCAGARGTTDHSHNSLGAYLLHDRRDPTTAPTAVVYVDTPEFPSSPEPVTFDTYSVHLAPEDCRALARHLNDLASRMEAMRKEQPGPDRMMEERSA